eukprot:COSAG04_NODE_1489_length_6551_cov_34.697768_4_plen_455_part_00
METTLLPEQGISLTVRDVTGEITVHENVRPAETDVETFRAAVAAARGTEPALLRLVRGDVPLDDGLRTLAKYGIVEDAELELVAQTAEEGKARQAAAFRDTLSAGAAAWIAEQLGSIGAVRLKLRNADGASERWRWFVWSVAADGSLHVVWSRNCDGSDYSCCWRREPREERTVTGVREESPATNELGLTVDVSEGAAVVVVAENEWARRFVLGLAAAAVGPSRMGALSDAAVSSLLVGCGCRSFEDVRGLLPAVLEGLGEEPEVRAALDVAFLPPPGPWRWAKTHADVGITGEARALATKRGDGGGYYRSAVCGEVLQAEGEAYAEFTWVSGRDGLMVGVARAGVDPSSLAGGLHRTADGWMYYCHGRGGHCHNGSSPPWVSGEEQGIAMGETLGLLLRRGSLAVYIQGRRVGVMCTGLSGALVWAADLTLWGDRGDISSVRIARRPPPADGD